MRKLNKRKVRWIIKQMCLGELSVWQIAKQQGVTPRWVRKLFERYLETEQFPFPKRPGKKPLPIPFETQQLIEETFRKTPIGAVKMEQLLDYQGVHIPHNTIHVVLREKKLAQEQPNKSNKRKWIRYERKHSNSLWHIDYCEIEGKQVVGVLDDASRFVPACNEYDNATAENAADILVKAIGSYGAPRQLVSDHGVQFTSIERESCPEPKENLFQQTLKKYGIQHIKARVKHPQTNGKMERWFGTLKKLKKHYGTVQKAVSAYNNDIHHMSLTNGHLRTPAQAFVEKMRGNA